MKKICNILLVDDDDDDFFLFTIALREVGPSIECQQAINGEEALRLLRIKDADLPDLILLDLNMPLMSGKECLIHLKNDEELKHIPVVIYSTSSYAKDIEEAHALGAADYMMKPSGYRGLVKSISALVETDWEKEEFHCLQF